MLTERVIALHEAAHAVADIVKGVPILRVTLEPTPTSLAHVRPAVRADSIEMSDWVFSLAAGAAAERKATGQAALGDENDLSQARLLIAAIAGTDVDAPQVTERLRTYGILADAFVALNWKWIERTADRLQRRRSLTGAEVADCMDVGYYL